MGGAWAGQLRARLAGHPDLAPWDHHLELRHLEMSIIDEIAGIPPVDTILEVGCGNGFGSAYLADRARLLVASDLPGQSADTHSIGLERTVRLFEQLGANHCVAVGATGEELPLATGSVDIVLALYSLEHVPDRPACLREIRRVLRDGGRLVAAVPAFAWSLHYPVDVYAGSARRFLAARRAPAEAGGRGNGSGGGQGSPLSQLRRAHPDFPLPTPHGTYRSWLEELVQQRPSNWVDLCRGAGFRVAAAEALSVVPCALLESVVGERRGFEAFQRLQPFDRRVCRRPWARHLAQFLCLVCEKDGR